MYISTYKREYIHKLHVYNVSVQCFQINNFFLTLSILRTTKVHIYTCVRF